MTSERQAALRILNRLQKRAAEVDAADATPVAAKPRGAGQRFFEGSMGGAAKGGLGGATLGALLGGYTAYKGAQGGGADNKELIKLVLMGALQGGILGGAGGTALGGGMGAAGSTLLGSRKQQPTY